MDREKLQVLVAGELNMDLILTGLNRFPSEGKEIIAPDMSLTLGSSSAIFASNLSALGTDVAFIGKTGRDAFGEQIIKSLSEKGVDTGRIMLSDTSATGLTVAFSYKNERAMVTYPGAMKELSEKDITNESLESYNHLHVSSIFLQPALKKGIVALFQRAKNARLTTSLDPQWDPEEKWDCDWESLLPLVDIFLPNLEELKNITKQPDPESCIDKIKNISNTIVLKSGIKGCLAWKSGELYQQPAFLNHEVKDAIGAGDSFNAGFIHQFIRNKPVKACLEFGALCGAINTTACGGTGAFTCKKDIQEIALKQFNYSIDDL